MKLYMAPMEGVTDYAYRKAHAQVYGTMDRYFTPFLVPSLERGLKSRERKEILPENNQGLCVIPQILTNNAEAFVELAKSLAQMGYSEVNLNLGCPSGTVTTKGRGAGFLARPLELDDFLEKIFDQSPLSISIKSRIGVEDVEEFERLLMIYNRYPMTELILHPRLMKEKYQGIPHMDIFHMAMTLCDHPLVYNGNIFTTAEYEHLLENYPEEKYTWFRGIMLGRGLIANPGLANACRGEIGTKAQMKAFHDRCYQMKKAELQDERNLLYHMKEFWFYMIQSFENVEKEQKKLRKLTRCSEYQIWVENLFRNADWNPDRGFQPPLKG